MINYDNDERGTVSVHNIKEIKDAKKTSFKQFKTFLVPYIEMANAWKKDGLEFDLITLRYNDEFIKINELCIIKYASENQRLKNDSNPSDNDVSSAKIRDRVSILQLVCEASEFYHHNYNYTHTFKS